MIARPGLKTFLHHQEGRVTDVAVSSDGRSLVSGFGVVHHLAGGYVGGGVMLWDVATRRRLTAGPFPLNEGGVSRVVFRPDGQTLATLSLDEGARKSAAAGVLWDPATRTRLVPDPLLVTEGTVASVAFSPDGSGLGHRIIRGFRRKSGVVIWDVAARRRLIDEPFDVSGSTAACSAFDASSQVLAVGFRGEPGKGGVVLWDMAARRRLTDEPLRMPEGDVYALAFSPDGQTLVAGFENLRYQFPTFPARWRGAVGRARPQAACE